MNEKTYYDTMKKIYIELSELEKDYKKIRDRMNALKHEVKQLNKWLIL